PHNAESALHARIRIETGATSVSNLTTEQCLQAIDLVEQLTIGCKRHNQAVAKAEDEFLKSFVRGTDQMPLKPVLLLMERDCSREILPVPVSPDELRKLTTKAVGGDLLQLPRYSEERQ